MYDVAQTNWYDSKPSYKGKNASVVKGAMSDVGLLAGVPCNTYNAGKLIPLGYIAGGIERVRLWQA